MAPRNTQYDKLFVLLSFEVRFNYNKMKYYTPVLILLLTGLLVSCNNDDINKPANGFTELNIQNCLVPVSSSELEVLTWNIEKFPIYNENTIIELAAIINELDPDLIAMQEISNSEALDALLAKLPGWEGQIAISGSLNLAYIYKTGEVEILENSTELFEDDRSAFPRSPQMLTARYTGGEPITFINIHLKCCGGEDNFNRRKDASVKLKQYIDTNLADKRVVLLGDFNDEITGDSLNTPFFNFIADSLNYTFADMTIANGNETHWSYPGWPSHIDHILLSDELYGSEIKTETLTFDTCDPAYSMIISDHRPLIITLTGF